LILATVCCALYVWCENSHVKQRLPYYDEKMAAALLMDRALRVYQDEVLEKGVSSDYYMDPRLDAIIGQQFSPITTEYGTFESKVIGADPNFAAVAVDLLTRAGVKRGDWVAVAFTGSYPGLNTAVLCACEVLGVTPVTITAVSASWWGASDPDFTWLDMEALLNRNGLVHSKPVAASYGGINDAAVGLSRLGRDLMEAAITRTGLAFIHEDNVPAAVDRWHSIYANEAEGHRYEAYVNIGSGVASLGHSENARLIRSGLSVRLPLQNYPARGVVHRFNAQGVPVVNMSDVASLQRQYGLSGAKVPLPTVGEGKAYLTDRYDLRIAGVSAALAIIIILALVQLDARLFRLRETGVDPDTLM